MTAAPAAGATGFAGATAPATGAGLPATAVTGRCYGIGVGPGDPELITLKAARLLRASPVVAYFSAVGRTSNARRVVSELLTSEQAELHLVYPVTTESLPPEVSYEDLLIRFYDVSAGQIAEVLDAGRDVAVVCEGDPFLHGSFMYLYNRLAGSYPTEVVPGVPSMLAASAAAGVPLVCREEALSVLAGTLPADELTARLRAADVAVIMKVGRRLAHVRRAVEDAGLLERAWYVERATMPGQRLLPLAAVDASEVAPYFSLVVVPSRTAGCR